MPYQSIVFPEQIKIFVKISLPFPIFEKPNLNLDMDDTFLYQETQQTCVPKKIEAPWIRKITGNIQFTETIVESDASLLYDDSYCPT